jgi:gamma-glutamyltranspeptidase/glutathione hydrolase
VRLDPASWAPTLLAGSTVRGPDPASVHGSAVVVGSRAPFAVHAGHEVLRAGGSAVDAAVTTSLAQVACALGSAVSYAGICTMVVFDAVAGECSVIDGSWRTLLDETDPLTIPPMGTSSGRGTLVGGFFDALGVAHQRFGRVPWAELFTPALYVAREGLVISDYLETVLANRAPVIGRTPEGRETYFPLPKAGDRFRQPAVAATLEEVAEHGHRRLYEGPWAQRWLDAVRREGGRARLDDLTSYRAELSTPLMTQIGDLTLVTPEDVGGAALLEALQVLDVAGDDALPWLVRVTRAGHRADAPAPRARTSRRHAVALVEQLRAGVRATVSPGTRSDFVCTADPQGNVVALVHSINTIHWGTTGIIVGGVSVPDPASFQQPLVAAAGPRGRVASFVNPMVALRDGRPVLASSSIGSGLHEVTVQCTWRTLLRGQTVAVAVREPMFHGRALGLGDSETVVSGAAATATDPADLPTSVVAGDFTDAVLEAVRAAGLPLVEIPADDATLTRGNWAGIAVLPGGSYEAGCTGYSGGHAAGS